MQITIFGASGRVGQQVVAGALDQGYSVIAFVHSHNSFSQHDRLQVVEGDISDRAAVTQAIQGSGAVISTLGSWHTKSKDIVATGTKSIIPAMQTQGVHRLITLTGSAAIYGKDRLTMLDSLNHTFLGLVAPKILRDGEEHLRLLEQSDLNWTCVRSPAMTGGKSSQYRLLTKLSPPWASVPRAAVAKCLVDLLTNSDYPQQAPVIYRR